MERTGRYMLSRDLVELTPRGFRQCQWLRGVLDDFAGRAPAVYCSQYRRARDTADLALPGRAAEVTALLNAALRRRHVHDET